MTTLQLLLSLTSGLTHTTYGWGERMCGDVSSPRVCEEGQPTASGEPLDSATPTAAVPAPPRMRLRPTVVHVKLADGPWRCHAIRVNDKSNPRWIGRRGLDLSPAAVRLLTARRPHAAWSARVELCTSPPGGLP